MNGHLTLLSKYILTEQAFACSRLKPKGNTVALYLIKLKLYNIIMHKGVVKMDAIILNLSEIIQSIDKTARLCKQILRELPKYNLRQKFGYTDRIFQEKLQ